MKLLRRTSLATILLISHSIIPAEAWVNNSVEATTFGGALGDVSMAVAEDSNQNKYIASNFRGASDFDPTSGYDTRTADASITSANDDIAVSKFDSNGDRIWTYSYTGPGNDAIHDIVVDSYNNIYIAGYFAYTVDFDPTSGVDSYTAVASTSPDAFVSKIDASGNYLWTKTFGGNQTDFSYVMTIDASDNLYLSGSFSGTADFNPSLSVSNNLTSAGNQDAFLVKLNANGEYLWAIKLGGGSTDYGYGLATGANGDIFFSGYFNSTIDLDPGAGIRSATSLGSADHFIVKLNSSGVYQWSTTLGSTGTEYWRSSLVADSQNNAYLALRANGNISFTSLEGSETFTINGSTDIEVFKFSDAGVLQWGRQLKGAGSDQVEDIEIDSDSNIYIGGAIGTGVTYLNPADSGTTITSNGSTDGFIWKLSSAGSYLGYSRFGGPAADYIYDLELTNSGRIIVTGSFSSSISLDTGTGSQTFTSSGSTDVFMLRIDSIAGAPQNLVTAISISSTLLNFQKGISNSITATTNTSGKVQFLLNGKRIAKCVSLRTSGTAPNFTATCSWKPSVQGSFEISARLIVDSATVVSSPSKMVTVQKRSGNR